MTLQIQQILPTYFEAERILQSEIWGKNLQFEKGELIKIVAPSGSGKSSLMHFLYGMRHDYNGTINWNNKSTRSFSIEEMAGLRKNNFSIVFQDLRLFPEQTVFSNIDIKRQLNPYHPAEKIKEMAERLGIDSKLNSLAKTCSYGEQQRIAIIRSLMQPFDFLLLDEPFSHLDNANSEKAMQLMIEEADKRKAAIIFADLERVDYFPFQKLLHL
jgi:putative ABC transport system ATP-binding protein